MKKTFGKKAVAAAVAAGLSSMAAQAVYVNPDGLGQALIYPYYTVQQVGGNGYNSLISVVNTTGDAKAVKVRIREGKASAEVLDFLLFLSPYDVWTAAIVPVDGTETSGAKIISADTSCIYPRKLGLTGVPFRNFKYAKDAVKDASLARTREGYIEMIEAATVTGALAADVTHTAGVPKCKIAEGLSDGLLVAPNAVTPYDYATNPSGGLMGQGLLINVQAGSESAYKAVALAGFEDDPINTGFGSETVSLNNADSFVASFTTARASDVAGGQTGEEIPLTVYAEMDSGIDAVSAALMRDSVMNEYVLESSTKSNTDWVMTFPTKHFYVGSDGSFADAPFSNKLGTGGACEKIAVKYWDREEGEKTPAAGDFSPLPPGEDPSTLCWESTVISWRSASLAHTPTGLTSGVLGSKNQTPILLDPGFTNGWAKVTFTGTKAKLVSDGCNWLVNGRGFGTEGGSCPGGNEVTFSGLPVVGFMVRDFNNGTLTCAAGACNGTYGSAIVHSTEPRISSAFGFGGN